MEQAKTDTRSPQVEAALEEILKAMTALNRPPELLEEQRGGLISTRYKGAAAAFAHMQAAHDILKAAHG